MAVRPIDAVQVVNDINLHHRPIPVSEFDFGFNNGLNQAMWEIANAPTLTPPNEIPPCYRPDGDGCAYQCYDGQDEPIDKCKECPLCYSDKQRHHAPPNEPLTMISIKDELPPDNERVLVYRPCMIDSDTGPYSVQWGWTAKRDGSRWAHLPDRRPPEGEEETE